CSWLIIQEGEEVIPEKDDAIDDDILSPSKPSHIEFEKSTALRRQEKALIQMNGFTILSILVNYMMKEDQLMMQRFGPTTLGSLLLAATSLDPYSLATYYWKFILLKLLGANFTFYLYNLLIFKFQ
ncbi:hypothetical protein ACJX0J_012978, partial [Zea mays]